MSLIVTLSVLVYFSISVRALGEATSSSSQNIKENKKISEYIYAAVGHYEKEDPSGMPEVAIPDSFDIPPISHSFSIGKMHFKNIELHGLSKFRIDHIIADRTKMKVEAELNVDVVNVLGNYTLSMWLAKTEGPFKLQLTNAYVEAIGKLEVQQGGKVEVQEMNADITVESAIMNLERLGFFANINQMVFNNVGTFIFESIKPLILKKINTHIRANVDKQLHQIPLRFQNSISAFDRLMIFPKVDGSIESIIHLLAISKMLLLVCLSVFACFSITVKALGEVDVNNPEILQLGEKKISEYVHALLEHYKKEDPVGMPGVPIPDPLDIPPMSHSFSVGKMHFENVKLHGLSKFRIDHVTADLAKMQVEAALRIDIMYVLGNYTLSTWLSRSEGPFTVQLTDVYVEALAKLEVQHEGKLEAQEMNMDITFKNIAMNFERLGFFASVFQGVFNAVGTFLFDSIKPFILTEVNTNMRTDVNKQVHQIPLRFPNSISPFDQLVSRHATKSAATIMTLLK
ncbi:hypothetical protein FQR65_LT00016 [Abscondita terminalis]|nr:hypothetical protein FQR65_LT00016 [Abscondita terminalis]